MDYILFQKHHQTTHKQRNVFMALTFGMLTLNILQFGERLTVSEKVIVLPPDTEKGFWLKGDLVSESYLEEWSIYLSQLLLNVSEKTISYQTSLVLKHVAPQLTAKLKAQLKEDKERLQKHNSTTTFSPSEINVNTRDMTVQLTGTLSTYVGKECISTHVHSYLFKFQFLKNRFLQLVEFKHLVVDGHKIPNDIACSF